jgi:hypothetical protein
LTGLGREAERDLRRSTKDFAGLERVADAATPNVAAVARELGTQARLGRRETSKQPSFSPPSLSLGHVPTSAADSAFDLVGKRVEVGALADPDRSIAS